MHKIAYACAPACFVWGVFVVMMDDDIFSATKGVLAFVFCGLSIVQLLLAARVAQAKRERAAKNE